LAVYIEFKTKQASKQKKIPFLQAFVYSKDEKKQQNICDVYLPNFFTCIILITLANYSNFTSILYSRRHILCFF